MRASPSSRSAAVAAVLTTLVTACGGDEPARSPAGSAGSSGAGGSGPTCVSPDVDEDGFDTIECGGTDCDDRDPGLYPGSPMGLAVEVVAHFAPASAISDEPQGRDVSAAADADGSVVIAFEGDSGLWFGQRSKGVWDLITVAPMADPRQSSPSITVSNGSGISIGFRQEGASPAAMLARGDGTMFIVETLWNYDAPPVVATAQDGTLWVAGTDDAGLFGIGPEAGGPITHTGVKDASGPPGTRFAIDSAGHHHIIWGAGGVAGRIPPIKYSYATDASGAWAITEFDEQCFYEKASLAVDGTDVHIAYVRPRNLQGVYYFGPGDDAPGVVIQDARGSFSDTPKDQGTAVAVYQGVARIAFVTNDGIYLASKLTDQFSSTLVEDSTETRAFGSPALIAAPDGLHLFYFGVATDGSDELQLKHAFLANDAQRGCTTR